MDVVTSSHHHSYCRAEGFQESTAARDLLQQASLSRDVRQSVRHGACVITR